MEWTGKRVRPYLSTLMQQIIVSYATSTAQEGKSNWEKVACWKHCVLVRECVSLWYVSPHQMHRPCAQKLCRSWQTCEQVCSTIFWFQLDSTNVFRYTHQKFFFTKHFPLSSQIAVIAVGVFAGIIVLLALFVLGMLYHRGLAIRRKRALRRYLESAEVSHFGLFEYNAFYLTYMYLYFFFKWGSLHFLIQWSNYNRYTLPFKSLGSVRFFLKKLTFLFSKNLLNWSKVTEKKNFSLNKCSLKMKKIQLFSAFTIIIIEHQISILE